MTDFSSISQLLPFCSASSQRGRLISIWFIEIINLPQIPIFFIFYFLLTNRFPFTQNRQGYRQSKVRVTLSSVIYIGYSRHSPKFESLVTTWLSVGLEFTSEDVTLTHLTFPLSTLYNFLQNLAFKLTDYRYMITAIFLFRGVYQCQNLFIFYLSFYYLLFP